MDAFWQQRISEAVEELDKARDSVNRTGNQYREAQRKKMALSVSQERIPEELEWEIDVRAGDKGRAEIEEHGAVERLCEYWKLAKKEGA